MNIFYNKKQKSHEKNGKTLWTDATNREMQNLKVVFDVLEDGDKILVGYEKSSYQFVFDFRMKLESEARWVKDGHRNPEPEWSNFTGVVSRESVRIALTYTSLNELNICACNAQNAYLQVLSSEKNCIICAPEFGLENVGKH